MNSSSGDCTADLVAKAISGIRTSIERYLAVNCPRIRSLVGIAQQKSVKIEFYGFFRYYAPSEEFPRFSDAVAFLSKCVGDIVVDIEGVNLELEEYGVLVSADDLVHICSKLVDASPLATGFIDKNTLS